MINTRSSKLDFKNLVYLESGGFGSVYFNKKSKNIIKLELFPVPEDSPRYYLEYKKQQEKQIYEIFSIYKPSISIVSIYSYFSVLLPRKEVEQFDLPLCEKVECFVIEMEYCPHKTLKDRLVYKTPIPHNHLLIHAIFLLEGLFYLHCNGIIHNDIKPKNIVFQKVKKLPKESFLYDYLKPPCYIPKIIDFGLSMIGPKKNIWDAGTKFYKNPMFLLYKNGDQIYRLFQDDLWSFGLLFWLMCVSSKLEIHLKSIFIPFLQSDKNEWKPELLTIFFKVKRDYIRRISIGTTKNHKSVFEIGMICIYCCWMKSLGHSFLPPRSFISRKSPNNNGRLFIWNALAYSIEKYKKEIICVVEQFFNFKEASVFLKDHNIELYNIINILTRWEPEKRAKSPYYISNKIIPILISLAKEDDIQEDTYFSEQYKPKTCCILI